MSAFGSPWGDIDRTKPEEPYVVSSDGWGWFAIFIVIAIPFFIIGALLTNLAAVIAAHPYISISVYAVLSALAGIILYLRGCKKYRIAGVIASFITLAPFALTEGLYMIPYIVQNSLFASVFEWILVTAAVGGITFFIFAVSDKIENGVIHLIISVVFFAIVFAILNGVLSSSDEINWGVVSSIYRLS